MRSYIKLHVGVLKVLAFLQCIVNTSRPLVQTPGLHEDWPRKNLPPNLLPLFDLTTNTVLRRNPNTCTVHGEGFTMMVRQKGSICCNKSKYYAITPTIHYTAWKFIVLGTVWPTLAIFRPSQIPRSTSQSKLGKPPNTILAWVILHADWSFTLAATMQWLWSMNSCHWFIYGVILFGQLFLLATCHGLERLEEEWHFFLFLIKGQKGYYASQIGAIEKGRPDSPSRLAMMKRSFADYRFILSHFRRQVVNVVNESVDKTDAQLHA